ncbi:MAG TPA: spore germination protein, partial [Syntrophaceticus sp.]|nr:spore germination protein [Syntrophaceticus sp.]
MLRFLSRLRNLFFLLKEKNNYKNSSTKAQQLTADLNKNIKLFRQVLGESCDVIIRQFKIARGGTSAALIFLDGLVDKERIDDHVLHPLMVQSLTPFSGTLKKLKDSFIFIDDISELKDFGEIVSAVLEGKVVLLVDGF